MGSVDAACISGFLCRLCSNIHRSVIHIYGEQGKKRNLPHKINIYLPVTVSPCDKLPKTICELCMSRVEQHHTLMKMMADNNQKYKEHRERALAAANAPPFSIEITETAPASEVERESSPQLHQQDDIDNIQR